MPLRRAQPTTSPSSRQPLNEDAPAPVRKKKKAPLDPASKTTFTKVEPRILDKVNLSKTGLGALFLTATTGVLYKGLQSPQIKSKAGMQDVATGLAGTVDVRKKVVVNESGSITSRIEARWSNLLSRLRFQIGGADLAKLSGELRGGPLANAGMSVRLRSGERGLVTAYNGVYQGDVGLKREVALTGGKHTIIIETIDAQSAVSSVGRTRQLELTGNAQTGNLQQRVQQLSTQTGIAEERLARPLSQTTVSFLSEAVHGFGALGFCAWMSKALDLHVQATTGLMLLGPVFIHQADHAMQLTRSMGALPDGYIGRGAKSIGRGVGHILIYMGVVDPIAKAMKLDTNSILVNLGMHGVSLGLTLGAQSVFEKIANSAIGDFVVNHVVDSRLGMFAAERGTRVIGGVLLNRAFSLAARGALTAIPIAGWAYTAWDLYHNADQYKMLAQGAYEFCSDKIKHAVA